MEKKRFEGTGEGRDPLPGRRLEGYLFSGRLKPLDKNKIVGSQQFNGINEGNG